MTEQLRQLAWWFNSEIVAIPWRVMAFVFVVALLFVPLFITEPYMLKVLMLTSIFALLAASWDLLGGYTGQFSLGHALFLGVGAYTAALLNVHLHLRPWATIPLGAVAALMTGLIVGIPALRLRGMYLALMTLTFPIMLTGIVFVFPDFSGGEYGIYGVDPLGSSLIANYYIVLLVMLGSALVMWKIGDVRSKVVRIGVILHAIREDEIAARVSGINTTRYKLLAFGISGFFAGISGGLYAHTMQIAGPSTLELMVSFNALLFSLFGGAITIYGPVAGTYILYPLIDFLRLNPTSAEFRMIIMALILILVLLFMPGGLTRWIRDKIEVECPRCKIINAANRHLCRVCNTHLHSGNNE